MKVKLRFSEYQLVWRKHIDHEGGWGWLRRKDKKFIIKNGQTPRCELDTYIHEALHEGLYDTNEEAIRETAHSITRLLWNLGYRKVK